jgi:hypothetical protein
MLRKLLVLVSLIVVFALAASAAEVSFSSPTLVGPLKLQPGKYKIKVMGNLAMFINSDTNKSFSAPFVQEKGEKRSNITNATSSTENGMDRVESIQIEGQDTKLVFK